MPPVLNKKMAGLPVWAWLALTAAGVGVGLYLRSRNSPESETGTSEDPCDQESPNYNPEACEAGKPVEQGTGEYGIEEGASNGVVPQYPGVGGANGGGGAGTYQPYYPGEGGTAACNPENWNFEECGEMPGVANLPTAHELSTAEEGGVETGSTTVVKINVAEAHGGSKGCNGKKKPKAKKGFKIVCESGKWSYEPVNANHKPKKKQKGSHHLTGGGAPNKAHNKTAGHGKRKKHTAKH